MLKVLYISPNGYLGGAERFVLNAALSHKSKGKVDAAILFFSAGEASREAQRLGIEYFVLKKSFRMRNPRALIEALMEIRKIVRVYDPAILHLTMPYSHIVLSLATVGLKIKKVWFQHGPVGERLDKIASLFPVDMLWFNSQFLKEKHHETWPQSRVRLQESVISLGVETHSGPHQVFSNPAVSIGTAGRICEGKGIHNIVTALGELKKEKNISAYRFFIAGSSKSFQDQEYGKELKKLVQSFNLEKEIEFLEHVENMQNFYQSLDVFIHSSIVPEPFGLVVAEAMASGCLVIASDRGGVADLLQESLNGIGFPATQENAVFELKKILERILSDKDEASLGQFRAMAQRGKSFIESNFSIKKMNSQMEDLYFQLEQRTE